MTRPPEPPKWVIRLIRWWVKPHLLEEIEGDLVELFKLFTVLAVILACSGLFALAAFTTERRSKEMAVRKILGASNWNILLQLSGQHARLAVIATLIATPVAWYFARQWLDHFAYRIDLSWWIFFLAGVSIIGLAILTSSFHAVKAASTSPAQALKQEE